MMLCMLCFHVDLILNRLIIVNTIDRVSIFILPPMIKYGRIKWSYGVKVNFFHFSQSSSKYLVIGY